MAGLAEGQWAFNDRRLAFFRGLSWSRRVHLAIGLQELMGLNSDDRRRPITLKGDRLYSDQALADESLQKVQNFAGATLEETGDANMPWKVTFIADFAEAQAAIDTFRAMVPDPRAILSFPSMGDDKRKADKVCIVGHGLAVLAFACALKAKGFDPANMTIITRFPSPAGPSSLVDLSHLKDEDKALFGGQLSPTYEFPVAGAVLELAKALGVGERFAQEGEDAAEHPQIVHGAQRLEFLDFLHYAAGFHKDPTKAQRVIDQLETFLSLYDSLREVSPSADEALWQAVDKTFGEFLKERGVPDLAPLLTGRMALAGSVGIEASPTATVLRAMHRDIIALVALDVKRAVAMAGLEVNWPESLKALPQEPLTVRAPRFGLLWQRGLEHLTGIKVLASTKVKSIEGRVPGQQQDIRVNYDLPTGTEGDLFQYVAIAEPYPLAAQYLKDASGAELQLFKAAASHTLHASVVREEAAEDEPGRFELFADALTGATDLGQGEVIGQRLGERQADGRRGRVLYQLVRHGFAGTEVEQKRRAFLDLQSVADAAAAAPGEPDVQRLGQWTADNPQGQGKSRFTVLDSTSSQFNWHFDQAGLQEELEGKLNELQGKQRTVYLHPPACTDSPSAMVEHAEQVVRKLSSLP